MWIKIKRVIKLLTGLFLSTLLLHSAYGFLVKAPFDLATAAKYSGQVVDKGQQSQFYSFRLAEHPYTFIV